MSHQPHVDDFKSALQRQNCFGCGTDNPRGLHLEFFLNQAKDAYVCEFNLDDIYTGPPGHLHGGIIATILDEAMGKANKLRDRVAVTRKLSIEYLRPVPLHKPLVAEGRVLRVRGRALYNRGEIRTREGQVLARSSGTFYTIDPEKMFARELEAERRRQLKESRQGQHEWSGE
ncbi:MAG: PaaI family thioesterase [Acidobacteriota bacterium]|nr:PaaI family thioesterase [Acidobacteriota bacterium]